MNTSSSLILILESSLLRVYVAKSFVSTPNFISGFIKQSMTALFGRTKENGLTADEERTMSHSLISKLAFYINPNDI